MSKERIVAVTGASGFIGSHISLKLLESGYKVRLVARGQKADRLRDTIGKDDPRVQVITITDIAADSLSAAFQDAYAVIHTASPLAGRADAKSSLTSALEGSLHVLREAERCGVTKVVFTATWANVMDPGDLTDYWSGRVFTSKDWGRVTTTEQVINEEHDPFWVYCATKLLSERASWKFAEEHPKIDVASINPPFVYGPFAQGFPIPAGTDIGANGLLYQLVVGQKGTSLPPQVAPYFCDVRDVAEAHVRVLDVPPAPEDVQSKRFLMCSGQFLFQDAVKLLAEKRPDLKDRLPSLQDAPPAPGPFSTTDTSGVKRQLKMQEAIGWEKTVIDTFDDLIKAEKDWH